MIDRSGFVFDPQGLGPRRLAALARGEAPGPARSPRLPGAAPATAEEAIAHIAGYALTRPVLVDLTADETHRRSEPALHARHGSRAGQQAAARRPARGERGALADRARARPPRSCTRPPSAPGLPIIDTYHKLTESGDRVERIEGLLSGTLGYVLSEVGDGTPFSRAVRSAMRLGYTEPDPREDLSGMDVGRKALILARLLGYRGELGRGRAVESLVPRWARALPLAEFLERLDELDAGVEAPGAGAARRGRRCCATSPP